MLLCGTDNKYFAYVDIIYVALGQGQQMCYLYGHHICCSVARTTNAFLKCGHKTALLIIYKSNFHQCKMGDISFKWV